MFDENKIDSYLEDFEQILLGKEDPPINRINNLYPFVNILKYSMKEKENIYVALKKIEKSLKKDSVLYQFIQYLDTV